MLLFRSGYVADFNSCTIANFPVLSGGSDGKLLNTFYGNYIAPEDPKLLPNIQDVDGCKLNRALRRLNCLHNDKDFCRESLFVALLSWRPPQLAWTS